MTKKQKKRNRKVSDKHKTKTKWNYNAIHKIWSIITAIKNEKRVQKKKTIIKQNKIVNTKKTDCRMRDVTLCFKKKKGNKPKGSCPTNEKQKWQKITKNNTKQLNLQYQAKSRTKKKHTKKQKSALKKNFKTNASCNKHYIDYKQTHKNKTGQTFFLFFVFLWARNTHTLWHKQKKTNKSKK